MTNGRDESSNDSLGHLEILYGEGAVEAWQAFDDFCMSTLPWSEDAAPIRFGDAHFAIFLRLSEIFLSDTGMPATMRVMLSGLKGENLTFADLPTFMACHDSLSQKIRKDSKALLSRQYLSGHIASLVDAKGSEEAHVRSLPKAREAVYKVLLAVGCRSQKSSRIDFPKEPMKSLLVDIARESGVPEHLVAGLQMHIDAVASVSPWSVVQSEV